MRKKRKEGKKFERPKEELREVVNFKDCRPQSVKNSHKKAAEGQLGFVKHLGNVNYIDQGQMKTKVNNQIKEDKDTIDRLKMIKEKAREIYEEQVFNGQQEKKKGQTQSEKVSQNLEKMVMELRKELEKKQSQGEALSKELISDKARKEKKLGGLKERLGFYLG